ncbi:retrovirus-related pol polyprotein from transposon TNT 1-94 [Tanacetum coccineum]
MQDKIHEFDRLKVWELVPRPDYVMVIGLKWIYKVMLDEYGDVLKDKARLVAKGYRQEEVIDFEEFRGFFAPVARIEAIRAIHCQWCTRYDHLTRWMSNAFLNGDLQDRILCQSACTRGVGMGHTIKVLWPTISSRVARGSNMSMMGQMSFFLGLQVSQSPRGIFINQAKNALETLKKYGMDRSDPVDTPMVDRLKLDEDLMGIPVDQTRFRGMVGSLMYLTPSHSGKTNVLSAEKISVLSCYFPVRYSNHIGEEISCHLWYASVEIPGKCVVRRLIRA